MSKRTLEEMMAVETEEQTLLRDATKAALVPLLQRSKDDNDITLTALMLERMEKHRVAFATTGCQCRLPLLLAPCSIRYSCSLWPAEVTKVICQMHLRNYASLLLAGRPVHGASIGTLDTHWLAHFARRLSEVWNKAHPNNLARWEKNADGSMDLIIE
jgi:hypothetical protein